MLEKKTMVTGILILLIPLSYIIGVHTNHFWIESTKEIEYVYDTQTEYVDVEILTPLSKSNITLNLEIPRNVTVNIYDNHTQNEIQIEQQALSDTYIQMNSDEIAIKFESFTNIMRLNEINLNISVNFSTIAEFFIVKGTDCSPGTDSTIMYLFEFLEEELNYMHQLEISKYGEEIIFEADENYWLIIQHNFNELKLNSNNNTENALKRDTIWKPIDFTPAYIFKFQNFSGTEEALLMKTHNNIAYEYFKFSFGNLTHNAESNIEMEYMTIEFISNYSLFESYSSTVTILGEGNYIYFRSQISFHDLKNDNQLSARFDNDIFNYEYQIFEINHTYNLQLDEIRIYINNLFITGLEIDFIVNGSDPILHSTQLLYPFTIVSD